MTPSEQPGGAPSEEITTLLGQGSEFSGKLTFEGTVRMDGRFSGEIFSEGVLVIGSGADVSADIAVRTVIIQGAVTGKVSATEGIEIHAPARVQGTLTSPQLFIEKGVVFDGTCQMSDSVGQDSSDRPHPDGTLDTDDQGE